MKSLLQHLHAQHRAAVDGMFSECEAELLALAQITVDCLKSGGKLLFCGNGGSACDAMHIAGEFVGRFVDDRAAIAAIALSADSGIISAVANDYGYEQVFARQVQALGKPGDVLIALSTSGKSPNVLNALATARAIGLKTALLTGEKSKNNSSIADICLAIPSAITAHIQEAHITALHSLASLVEYGLFGKK